MPYEIKKDGNKWALVNKHTGELKSYHASKEMAQKAIAAIYANTGEKKSGGMQQEYK